MSNNIGVMIGRFQPFHNGHLKNITTAIEKGIFDFVICVGSASSSQSIKNPFTLNERTNLIVTSLFEHFTDVDGALEYSDFEFDGQKATVVQSKGNTRKSITFHIVGINDYVYNEARWKLEVLCSVVGKYDQSDKYFLLGYEKDESSYYLKMFPEFDTSLLMKESYGQIDATYIRNMLYAGNIKNIESGMISNATYNFLRGFSSSKVSQSRFSALVKENEYINMYAKTSRKFEPVFVTVDNIVTQNNHILLIKRKSEYGSGLWALPGGFLNQRETLKESALRELKEETKLKVPKKVILANMDNGTVFDYPSRSLRGRVVTHVFYTNLGDYDSFPLVKGCSDAEQARWVSLGELKNMREEMFSDPWDIIMSIIDV